MTVRVVLVDDHALFRAGVRGRAVGAADRVVIVGEAADVDEAIAVIRATTPDVVLLDVHLPGGGGQRVITAVRNDPSPPRFLALSVSDSAEDVIAVVRAGARGYVTKTIRADELIDAVESGCTAATPCSRRASPGSCSTRSPASCRHRPTPTSTTSRHASRR